MKRLLWIYFLLLAVNILPAEDKGFTVKLNPDYYNPFACSFAWQFSYAGKLPEKQYVNLHIEIYDRKAKKSVDSFDMPIIPGRTEGRFYFFISTKPANVELSFRSPDSGFSYNYNLADVFLPGQRILCRKTIVMYIDKQALLAQMKMIPERNFNLGKDYYFKDISVLLPHPSQEKKGRPKALNYNIFITPELKIQQAASPSLPQETKVDYTGLSEERLKEELANALKKRAAIEELYKQKKATIDELNQVQRKINTLVRLLPSKTNN